MFFTPLHYQAAQNIVWGKGCILKFLLGFRACAVAIVNPPLDEGSFIGLP